MIGREAPLLPRVPDGTAFKLIGLGGVGGIAARYLVVFLASLGVRCRVVLIDGDAFEPANAARMLFAEYGNKAAVVRDDLLAHARDSAVALEAIPEYVTHDNAARLLQERDIVLLAVDNHATRKVVDDACARLDDVCLISGGNDGVEGSLRGTYGNVQVGLRRGGRPLTPSLARFHPEIAQPADAPPGEDCIAAIVSTPQILFANLATASAMLNALWLQLCGALHYSELCFDIHDGLMRPAAVPGPVA